MSLAHLNLLPTASSTAQLSCPLTLLAYSQCKLLLSSFRATVWPKWHGQLLQRLQHSHWLSLPAMLPAWQCQWQRSKQPRRWCINKARSAGRSNSLLNCWGPFVVNPAGYDTKRSPGDSSTLAVASCHRDAATASVTCVVAKLQLAACACY